ncbi:poly-beta-1,6-N-acetyl-D-glucosamine N-deacetylase PgaB [Klebsiella sp. WP4-W18-ESBL-05]|uniref:poly-beta-1,6-N-acetyl-D-glucosamine N-deacetylase PgaB n=1 Tax=Klebsiella sp. WP4-W18-ESBL-05 TaxID=2675713 RepID=UPI0015DC143C|nr:poly-beta-1,6-N-acetyl-D-glucosamine N-deacetylase PgaB [Klebsiella sp. WP4-W18-ESBL-05]BBR59290.1 poly-beta-1,6-N-acetyl-D-glucosamine N-deacetylase PgaB [Klebsiella sp. WP4-W18-ESBL-05]
MLNIRLRISLVALGWLCLSAAVCAQAVPFIAPRDRSPLAASQPWPKNHFLVLGYHDVEDDVADQRYLAVRTSALNEQISWLLHNGYHAVSVQDIIDAHASRKTLPPKAFLLSFDDGYSSFYTRVWPLLKAWNVPALWAPVGSWVDTPAGQKVNFGGLMTPRDRFATWQMVQEVSRSSLVEVGAHTWASHYGLPANPQGSLEPAIANRFYDRKSGRYETDQQFTQRISEDVRKVTEKISSVTGKAPRAWVWPYGEANGVTLAIAKKQGYQLAFTLADGLGDARNIDNIPRMLISGNPSLKAFASMVTQAQEPEVVRVMHVDLDYLYDPDIAQQTRNIDRLVQRVYDMKISHVFLQAFSDPQGDGNVKAPYFPNRWLPVRADLFNFVSWQLQTRGRVKVFAWMPVLAFNLAPPLPRVQRWDPQSGRTLTATEPYIRLSPWNTQARRQITDLYEDLARYAPFNGILFHDDAVLSDFEDAGPEALSAWRQTGSTTAIAEMAHSPAAQEAWTRFKSQALTAFTLQLSQATQRIRGPQIQTARNIFALPLLEPKSETWFAQNLDDFLAAYDWTVPMAMPLMESISPAQSHAWLSQLVRTVAARPGALNKTIFELQAKDWNQRQQNAVPDALLVKWMQVLQLNGVKNYGYYPDDFINNQPDISHIRPAFSSYWYPNND